MAELAEILTPILALISVLFGGKLALVIYKLKHLKDLIVKIDAALEDNALTQAELNGIIAQAKLLLGITGQTKQ